MKSDIILAGVGGQGILSIAAAIGLAAASNRLFVKQSEVHGMSQRGGDVQSHLRISDRKIYSDLIPKGKADIIISVEPMEALRYLPWLSESGWIVSNSVPYVNIPSYPPAEEITAEIKKIRNSILFDAESVARDCGSVRSANMVILGAAAPFIGLPLTEIEKAVAGLFASKGEEVVKINLKAFRAGLTVTGRA
ncbi:MAG TPA: indolepyruvate oxidoreductase subunit beta [Bacteroidales bacterium]|nr:indolepyruvate oxidoreductase subunit beta [Bacteroidales bacterium]HRR94375.1 indolepyruvate oxidoreductase subunit beta [Bacteroidales bacterium]HRT90644.1 indolepyruvate oxidoreductase subunit beta [Bacteroidales bacterium]